MDDIRAKCINLLLDRMIPVLMERGGEKPEIVFAYLVSYPTWPPLTKEPTETLLDFVWDEYKDAFEDSKEAQAVAEPDKATLETWVMKQTPYNWLAQM